MRFLIVMLASMILSCMGACAVFAEDVVQGIEVTPRFGTAPATVRIKATIDHHPDNRRICAGYDGPAKSYEACQETNTDPTKRTYWFEFRNVPGGQFVAFAGVLGINGRQGVKVTPFCIQGRVEEGVVECGQTGVGEQ